MPIGLVGRKAGMTRVFDEQGASIPVTVLEMEPNRVTQVKTAESDGYRAIQVTTGTRKASRVRKPQAGHLAKAGVEAGRGLWEFRLADGEGDDLQPGSELTVTSFESGQFVDAIGTSIGKGYAGVVKRHNFRTQDATHGNSLAHRAPGSIGQNQSPGRVFKGKRMAGHMGNARRTAQNLTVVRVDEARNVLLVKGAVPGPRGGDVIIRPAVKSAAAPEESEMQLDVVSDGGKKAKDKVEVADVPFGQQYNEPLVHQVVTAYLAGARAGTRKHKSRADVRGGGAKPWRQKGTGRARVGSIRSPLWRSGGVTFAARPRDYAQKVNRKMYRGAMRSIVSELVRRERFVVVESFSMERPKTRELVERLGKLGLSDVLIVVTEPGVELELSARNLHDVAVLTPDELNPVNLLAFDKVLITVDALKRMEERLS